jgi:CDP-4-dehydro-6-deoxyglucose reductase
MHQLCLDWQRDHANFSYIPVISDALPEDNWQGRTGFVHRAVLEDFPDLSGYQVYACGAPIVVESAHKTSPRTCKLPEEEFFSDAFTPAPAASTISTRAATTSRYCVDQPRYR